MRFGWLIGLALRWRKKPRYIGLCQACRMTVRTDDEWRTYGTGVAHRECVEYVSNHGRRRERPVHIHEAAMEYMGELRHTRARREGLL